MKPTVYDVARESGLSQPTVSLILNRRGDRYSPDTRRRVIEAAKKLGYVPDSRARSIALGRKHSVALVLSTRKNRSTTPARLLDGVTEALANRNLELTVSKLSDDRLSRDEQLPLLLREWSCSGLLINYTHDYPERMLELIRRQRIPSVWTNNKLDADCVYPDDFTAARSATEALLHAGHTRVAFVQYTRFNHYSLQDRADGYTVAMESAGLAPRIIRMPPVEERIPDRYGGSYLEFTRSWLSADGRPTGVVTSEEAEVQSVVGNALRVGLTIPDDLSIVALRNDRVDTIADIYISQFYVPWEEVGRQAVESLVEKVSKPASPREPVVIPWVWYARGATVAPPPNVD